MGAGLEISVFGEDKEKVQIPFALRLRDNSLWAPVWEPQAH
jgi:hypothetical protein